MDILYIIIVVVLVHTFFVHNAEHKDLSIKEHFEKLEMCSEKEAALVLKTPQLIFDNILKIISKFMKMEETIYLSLT